MKKLIGILMLCCFCLMLMSADSEKNETKPPAITQEQVVDQDIQAVLFSPRKEVLIAHAYKMTQDYEPVSLEGGGHDPCTWSTYMYRPSTGTYHCCYWWNEMSMWVCSDAPCPYC